VTRQKLSPLPEAGLTPQVRGPFWPAWSFLTAPRAWMPSRGLLLGFQWVVELGDGDVFGVGAVAAYDEGCVLLAHALAGAGR
jgi:hypothetical protein